MYLIISIKSEAFASELLETLEEMRQFVTGILYSSHFN